MATITISGVTHSYNLTDPVPNTPVLVLIHGWLLSQAYWQPLVDRLAPHYQCLSYDLRGFGGSRSALKQRELSNLIPGHEGRNRWKLKPREGEPIARSSRHATSLMLSEPQTEALVQPDYDGLTADPIPSSSYPLSASRYTAAAYAHDLRLLLQSLGINHAWLVGHSLGGSVALWGAAHCADWVKGVICLNAGGGIYLKEEFERFRTAGQQLVKTRPEWLRSLPLVDLLFARMNVARPIDRRWGKQRVIDFVTADPEAALGSLLDSTTETEVHQLPCLVSQLQQPVYFMTGTQDTIMEPRYVRHLASFHSLFGTCGDNVLEIADCGHLSMVEQPDIVANHIRGIVSQY